MTRQEFIDDVTSFSDLIDFCNENDCYICEDVIDDCVMSDWVWEDIHDWCGGWRELAGMLGDIPDCEWYRRNGCLEYDGLDDSDFDDYKSDVLDWANNNDVFDEEDPDSYGDGCWYTDPVTGETLFAGAKIEQDSLLIEGFFEL